jgi:ABC-type transport system involved in multi-copper enzyme maturation permease subunit
MLTVSALCIIFCLSVSVEGGTNLRPGGDYLYHGDKPMTGPSYDAGHFGFLFGAFRVSLARDREEGVHFLEIIFGMWAAGSVGLLLTLIWTAGFLPEYLQPSNASVLFAKPVPRWLLLVGKFVGVVLIVALQAAVFFVGTWFALGIKTGVWSNAYLLGAPILVGHFAVIFSFSAFLAVCTRSTVACVLGSMLFWVVCLGMNYGRHAVLAQPHIAPDTPALSPMTRALTEAGYWLLPKPADWLVLLEQTLHSDAHITTFSSLPEFRVAREMAGLDFGWSILSSLSFAIAILAIAGRHLAKAEY